MSDSMAISSEYVALMCVKHRYVAYIGLQMCARYKYVPHISVRLKSDSDLDMKLKQI